MQPEQLSARSAPHHTCLRNAPGLPATPAPFLLCLQPPVAQLLALAPLNLVALWFSDQDELRISAGVSLAAVTVQLLGAQHSQKLGRALI